MEYAYKLNRKCGHCGKAIADQVHAARNTVRVLLLKTGVFLVAKMTLIAK